MSGFKLDLIGSIVYLKVVLRQPRACHGLPSMTLYRAIGKTIKVSLSFSSASFTFNGNVVNLGSKVVHPSARGAERMPSIRCVFTPCC